MKHHILFPFPPPILPFPTGSPLLRYLGPLLNSLSQIPHSIRHCTTNRCGHLEVSFVHYHCPLQLQVALWFYRTMTTFMTGSQQASKISEVVASQKKFRTLLVKAYTFFLKTRCIYLIIQDPQVNHKTDTRALTPKCNWFQSSAGKWEAWLHTAD